MMSATKIVDRKKELRKIKDSEECRTASNGKPANV